MHALIASSLPVHAIITPARALLMKVPALAAADLLGHAQAGALQWGRFLSASHSFSFDQRRRGGVASPLRPNFLIAVGCTGGAGRVGRDGGGPIAVDRGFAVHRAAGQLVAGLLVDGPLTRSMEPGGQRPTGEP